MHMENDAEVDFILTLTILFPFYGSLERFGGNMYVGEQIAENCVAKKIAKLCLSAVQKCLEQLRLCRLNVQNFSGGVGKCSPNYFRWRRQGRVFAAHTKLNVSLKWQPQVVR